MAQVPKIFIVLLLVMGCTNKQATEKKEIAGLLLPMKLEKLEEKEEWLPNGDGFLLHRYRITQAIYENIAVQLRKRKSHNLPFEPNTYLDDMIYDYVEDTDRGIYQVINDFEDNRDVLIIVLNFTKMELIILKSSV